MDVVSSHAHRLDHAYVSTAKYSLKMLITANREGDWLSRSFRKFFK